MANLWEIDQAILACVDTETGEIIDAEALDSLIMQRTQKIEAVALWIKNLRADAAAYKAEKTAFFDREKAATKKADQLEAWLAKALQGDKFSTYRCAVSFRRSEKVDITDESLIPKEFLKEAVTYTPDKTAIKQAIKAGVEVGGCVLTENYNAQIK